MDNHITVCDYRNASGEDLKLQASEIIGLTEKCIADAADGVDIQEADARDTIVALQLDHAQVLGEQAHRLALSVMRMEQDSPIRRHMQDSAQYGLAVAGAIIKAGRAIYDAHAASIPTDYARQV